MAGDKVTITLFSRELPNGKFHEGMFSQRENIENIKRGLSQAAVAAGREPPEFVLSVNLIPNWKKENNGYQNEDYLKLKDEFLTRTQNTFGDVVEVEDFYNTNLSEAEKTYLDKLDSGGSNPDIIKTRAIVKNGDRRHLQIDSNTIISDYKSFYNQTFGAPEDQQMDALNASYYDNHYVSTHNKVVYTTPGGKVAGAIAKHYAHYIEDNKNNPEDKKLTSNFIYKKLFTTAMIDIDLTRKSMDPSDGWIFCPAVIDKPEYRITPNVVLAVNKSWDAASKDPDPLENLKKLPPVKVGPDNANCDFQCFYALVKKYTGNLWQHKIGLSPGDPDPRDQLLNLSNKTFDMNVLASFYNHAVKNLPDKVELLAKLIPNTPKGNVLTNRLFNCSVIDLHANPVREARPSVEKGISTTAALISTGVGSGKSQTIEPAQEKVQSGIQSESKEKALKEEANKDVITPQSESPRPHH